MRGIPVGQRERRWLCVRRILEQNQSKRALVKSQEGGFFLRKKPLEDIASE
jgi:hypothetical protein